MVQFHRFPKQILHLCSRNQKETVNIEMETPNEKVFQISVSEIWIE